MSGKDQTHPGSDLGGLRSLPLQPVQMRNYCRLALEKELVNGDAARRRKVSQERSGRFDGDC